MQDASHSSTTKVRPLSSCSFTRSVTNGLKGDSVESGPSNRSLHAEGFTTLSALRDTLKAQADLGEAFELCFDDLSLLDVDCSNGDEDGADGPFSNQTLEPSDSGSNDEITVRHA